MASSVGSKPHARSFSAHQNIQHQYTKSRTHLKLAIHTHCCPHQIMETNYSATASHLQILHHNYQVLVGRFQCPTRAEATTNSLPGARGNLSSIRAPQFGFSTHSILQLQGSTQPIESVKHTLLPIWREYAMKSCCLTCFVRGRNPNTIDRISFPSPSWQPTIRLKFSNHSVCKMIEVYSWNWYWVLITVQSLKFLVLPVTL
jgi:hypothetical protein